MKKNFKVPQAFYRVSVKAIELRGNRILLVKEITGEWNLPGGGLDHGEKPHDCLRREVKEEMGVGIKQISKFPIVSYPMQYKTVPRLVLGYKVKFSSLKFKPSDECVELGFFSPAQIKKMKFYPDMKEGILDFINTRNK